MDKFFDTNLTWEPFMTLGNHVSLFCICFRIHQLNDAGVKCISTEVSISLTAYLMPLAVKFLHWMHDTRQENTTDAFTVGVPLPHLVWVRTAESVFCECSTTMITEHSLKHLRKEGKECVCSKDKWCKHESLIISEHIKVMAPWAISRIKQENRQTCYIYLSIKSTPSDKSICSQQGQLQSKKKDYTGKTGGEGEWGVEGKTLLPDSSENYSDANVQKVHLPFNPF